MNKIIILLFFVFILNFISPLCEEGQIDINSASQKELEKIKWVGPATGEKIIDMRPFLSIDELIIIPYITESRVEDIKTQGLACVANETSTESTLNKESSETKEIEEIIEIKNDVVISPQNENPQKVTFNAITLEPKDIKKIENKKIKESNEFDKNKLIMFGFFGFSVLIGLLLLIQKNKYKENEFG